MKTKYDYRKNILKRNHQYPATKVYVKNNFTLILIEKIILDKTTFIKHFLGELQKDQIPHFKQPTFFVQIFFNLTNLLAKKLIIYSNFV